MLETSTAKPADPEREGISEGEVSAEGEGIAVHDPSTGAIVGRVDDLAPSEVTAAVTRAHAAQVSWSALSIAERRRALTAARKAFVRARGEIIDLLAGETGKPRFDVTGEAIAVCLDIRSACRFAPAALRPRQVGRRWLARKRRFVEYRPHGVVGVIGPWNAPLTLSLGDAMYALVAGNAVVVKPSEVTPLAVKRAVEAMATALPADVLQVVTGGPATGSALVDAVDMICATGSPTTGRRIMERAAARLTPVLLELGGKDPMIVLEDANLERAANAAVWGGFFMAGQVCMSIERVFVVDEVADRFLALALEKTRRLRVGPSSEDVDLGPLTTRAQLAIVERHVEEARRDGAEVLCGGTRLADVGEQFYAPTILAKVRPDMAVMREETFGPVIAVCRVRDGDEAVELANRSHLGLNASIWTRDLARGRRLASRLASGSVCINDCILNAGDAELPFGGVKQSGIGTRHGGVDGVRAFTRPCAIRIDRGGRARDVAWFPYRSATARLIERGLGWIWG